MLIHWSLVRLQRGPPIFQSPIVKLVEAYVRKLLKTLAPRAGFALIRASAKRESGAELEPARGRTTRAVGWLLRLDSNQQPSG